MYGAKANPDRQRLDIVIDQALSPEDFDRLINAVKVEAAQLKSGWVAAVDLRGMWVDNPFINQQLEALQDALLKTKAGKIGTLLESDPILMHLWQAGTRTQSNVITKRFFILEDWEKFLSQP